MCGHRVADGYVGPDGVEQSGFGYQLTGVFGQVPQDRKSFASETDFLVFTPQLLILRIEPERRKETYFRSHALPISTNCKPITAQLYESSMTSREPALIVPSKGGSEK
jgi:hypothetical protein